MGVGKKFQERWNNGYLYDEDHDDLGITFKQAMGVGKKFQERWNNGYLYDDDSGNGRRLKGYPPLCNILYIY